MGAGVFRRRIGVRTMDRWTVACLIGVIVAILPACERERRELTSSPEPAPSASTIATGQGDARGRGHEGNAFDIAQGQRYFRWYNCNGCHANGGGGMGPALMDAQWRYGGEIAQIYASIEQGRPNGMPAFGERLGPTQIWQLAAYVRSLSGQADKLAAPSRADAMRSIPPINNINRQPLRGPDGGAR
jgi:cytochrome c oxidase cbb3-type subunit 3